MATMWVVHPDAGPEPVEMEVEQGDGLDWFVPDLARVMLEGVHVFESQEDAEAEALAAADREELRQARMLAPDYVVDGDEES